MPSAKTSMPANGPVVASGVAPAVLATLSWMLTSSLLIALNKALYVRGFNFPLFVTGLGQLFSVFAGLLLAAATPSSPLRPPSAAARLAPRLAPVVLATAATMFTGNFAYLYLSVAFIQILKAFTPGLTLLLCCVAGLERASGALAASVLMIAGGTMLSVIIERGTPAFQAVGFVSFLLSSLSEAFRVVGAQVLLGKYRLNVAESLVYIGGPAAVLLLGCSALWEGQAISRYGLAIILANPSPFLGAALVSGLVNLTCFAAIQRTSSLTFKVSGCVKNIAVVWWGMLAHGELVSPAQMGGYLVSVGGFVLYSRIKVLQQPKHPEVRLVAATGLSSKRA